MKLEKIIVKNIRSFKDTVEFIPNENFNVLIGANGSGKSNLLDIIYITIRHYFLHPYQLSKTRNENGLEVRLNRITDPCGIIEQILPKFEGDHHDSKITIELKVTESDIRNLSIIKLNKDKLKATLGTYFLNFRDPINFLNSEWQDLQLGQTMTYTIVNYKVEKQDNLPTKFYREYLNSIEGIFFAAQDLNISLTHLMLYISPFRAINKNALEISLSNSSYFMEKGEVAKSSSRSTSSLIKLASLFFAEKHRKYEMNKEGYRELWDKDPDVRFVTEALAKIDYTWDLTLIDANKNTYIVNLKKNVRNFLLNEASSGEVELINFILGLITLDMNGGIIIIDEPELHLHPQWVGILRNFFLRFSNERTNHLFISTHSATFINTTTYPYISRVYKGLHGESRIHKIEIINEPETKDNLHFINATNNEKVFFLDFVIMVEGDTDEIIFKRILQDIRKT